MGPLVTKTALLSCASSTLAVGAAVGAATILKSWWSSYTRCLVREMTFLHYRFHARLEIFVVALYAVARIDLLFHVPDGSSKPGDYSAAPKVLVRKGLSDMCYEIEEHLGHIGIGYETISAPVASDERTEFVIAELLTNSGPPSVPAALEDSPDAREEGKGAAQVDIPPRPDRVSRQATMMQTIRPSRLWCDTMQGVYITGPLDPPVRDGYFPLGSISTLNSEKSMLRYNRFVPYLILSSRARRIIKWLDNLRFYC